MEHVVTGKENPIDPSTPEGALAEFYWAFNGRDLGLMAQNWDDSEDASMDNPLGGIRRGWPEIREVYQRVFGSRARVQVEFHDFTLHRFGEAFLAVGRERGTLVAGGESLDLKIRTSRLFVRRGARWRQFHHHGSVEDPQLLAKYQALVRNPAAAP